MEANRLLEHGTTAQGLIGANTAMKRAVSNTFLFIHLFIYYKIVHTVQDRQNKQSNIKRLA